MPLSEHEERILAEIERRLSQDDPRFVQRARRVGGRGSVVVRWRLAVVGFVVGLGCLLAVTFSLVLGLVGFGLMFGSVLLAVTALRGGPPGSSLRQRLQRIFEDRQDAR